MAARKEVLEREIPGFTERETFNRKQNRDGKNVFRGELVAVNVSVS